MKQRLTLVVGDGTESVTTLRRAEPAQSPNTRRSSRSENPSKSTVDVEMNSFGEDSPKESEGDATTTPDQHHARELLDVEVSHVDTDDSSDDHTEDDENKDKFDVIVVGIMVSVMGYDTAFGSFAVLCASGHCWRS